MKKLLAKYSNSTVTAFLIFGLTVVAVLASLFCFFIGRMDIPLGFLLGGVLTGGLSLLATLAEKRDEKKQVATFSILIIAVRLMLLIGISLLLAFMYYRWEMKIFNLFSFVGIYTASIVCSVVVHLISKK